MKRSSPMKRSPMPRGQPTDRRRKVRTREEFTRIYGSPDRAEWVKALPCVVCGATPCDNAHVRTGGMSRKADATSIVPLCSGPRGHHAELHARGIKTFGRKYDIDLCRCAERIENAWQCRNPMTSVASILRGEGCE